MSGPRRKFVTGGDFVHLATLLALFPVALLFPVKYWTGVCRAYAQVASILRFERLANTATTLTILQRNAQTDTETTYRQCLEMTFECRLQIVDQNLFRRAVPQVRLNGREHIDKALEAGQGVVLLTTPSAFSDLVVKTGLMQAGFSVTQLSRPEHGFSNSVLGIATINRLRTRIEDRFLKERVHIDSGTEKQAMLRLKRIITANGIVNITVGSSTRRPHDLRIRGGRIPVASGPVRLAKMTGAALIPVFGYRVDDMSYAVDVSEAIDVQEGDLDECLNRYADLLCDYIDRNPYQCRGFDGFVPDE